MRLIFSGFMTSSFSIQAVAERTGLSPHVIRAWERRYRAIEPERSPGKHRLYSEAEIERLAMLRRAVEGGHSIGRIARMPVAELHALVARLPPAAAAPSRALPDDRAAASRSDAIRATERFDAAALETTLRHALLELGHNGLLRLVVAPLAEEVGDRWRRGELTAAHEHFFTAGVKVFLGGLTRQFATPLTAPQIVVATPAGQLHELGAIMAAATAANLGWRPIYLGPGLPAHEIAGAALRNEAAAVALSIVYPEDDPTLARELTDLARLLPAHTRILAGGRAAHAYFDTLVRIGALYADSIEEFADRLDALRRRSPAPQEKHPA
jgi:DNA-binding transcriptional MerR regulator/methylmalonyl-CoA mutase cobalamin-binding subunit